MKNPIVEYIAILNNVIGLPAFRKFRKNAKCEQASFWSKLKVILMAVVMIWHRLDNIHSKGNLMLYAMYNKQ